MAVDIKLYEQKIEKMSDRYYESYRDQMDLLAKTPLVKMKGGLDFYDVYVLGKQLEAFDVYKSMCEEDGSVAQLGTIPNIAYDVITVAYGTSVIPLIASVQPVDEEQGTVYFKNIKAGTTKGSVTEGDVLMSSTSSGVTPSAYASNYVDSEVAGTGDGSTTAFNATLANAPVRPQTIKVALQDSTTVFGQDDGKGNIIGAGVSGSINYNTGAISLTFQAAPASGKEIYVSYQINYELADDIPSVQSFWDSTSILARIFALKSTVGMLQSYGMRKRFGVVAEEELAKDLVAEINSEVGGALIRQLNTQAPDTVSWSKTPPSGVSYYEHKQTFKDALADVESTLVGQAGRGVISAIVAGRNVASIISTLPGFTKISDGSTIGVHLFGSLDGMSVIRVPDASVLDANKAVCLYKGASPFEAAGVYAPYMPLVVTSTLPSGKNPLSNQRAAAVWAGVEVLVKNFVVGFEVTS